MERYNISVSLSAENDLKELFLYIKNQLLEPQIALKKISKIEESILSLETMPKRHELIKSNLFPQTEIRKFIVENHIVFYNIDDNTNVVNIIRVLYARRNWEQLF